MLVKDISVNDIRFYENNPRNNEKAVEAVAESIRQFGFRVPCGFVKRNGHVFGNFCGNRIS